jgi:hypothetical protein
VLNRSLFIAGAPQPDEAGTVVALVLTMYNPTVFIP